jgi:tetratricopeptide (TPR) repeat protein
LARLWPRTWAVSLILLSLGVVSAVATRCCVADAQDTAPSSNNNNKSWTDSVTSPFKKLGQAVSPKSSPTAQSIPDDDPTSLQNKSKPTADLYVAIAQYYEHSDKLPEAERQSQADWQYQLALKEKADHLPALLGEAQLKERMQKPDKALELYERAVKAAPRNASVHNNIGLCYARQGRLDEAVAALNRAVQLEPKNPLYHNNIAAVLVDQNHPTEALAHLREVHGEAAAYYNMGYLLNKKGQTQAALQQFTQALNADPTMDAAQRWIDCLQRTTTQARLPQHPMANGVKISSQPVMPSGDVALSPDDPMLRRLPPTKLSQPPGDVPALPGISYEQPYALVAPLPPVLTNASVSSRSIMK